METNNERLGELIVDGKRRRVMRGLSLQPEHDRALRSIADQQGHRNISRVIQDLIEAEMRSRVGKDWRAQFADGVVAEPEGAVA